MTTMTKLDARDERYIQAIMCMLAACNHKRWFRILAEVARRLKLGTLVPDHHLSDAREKDETAQR